MAHYAFLDEKNFVTEIIVGIDETELIEGKDPETWYGEFRGQVCKRTSASGSIRKNPAEIGGTYDERLDAFIPIKQFESWLFDEATCAWKAPVDYPSDGQTYLWREATLGWELADFSEPSEITE
jgi:hypothetical protein